MSKHTPGPWTAEPNGGDDDDMRRLYICTDMGARTALAEAYSVDHGDPEANARLIAAAPDLLAALKEIIAGAKRGFPGCTAALEAIAKAEGAS